MGRREVKIALFSLVVLLSLALFFSVSAADWYTNERRPYINVTFPEEVNVLEKYVNDSQNIQQHDLSEYQPNENNQKYYYRPDDELPDGEYLFYIKVEDYIGNPEVFTEEFIVDRDPPDVVSTIPLDEGYFFTASPTLELVADEELSLVYYEMKGLSYALRAAGTSGSNYRYSSRIYNLVDGHYRPYIQIMDLAGNPTYPSDYDFYIVAEPLSMELLYPPYGVSQTTQFTLQLMTSRNTTCNHSLTGNAGDWENFDVTGERRLHENDMTVLRQPGNPLTFYVECWDKFQKSVRKQFALSYDDRPPVISVTANPELVTYMDSGYQDAPFSTELIVQSTENHLDGSPDPVICRYLILDPDDTSDYESTPFTTMQPFGVYCDNNVNCYYTREPYVVRYENEAQQIPLQNQNEYKAFVKCKDLAGNYGSSETTFTIDMPDEPTIYLHKPTPGYVSTTTPAIELTTSMLANVCSYKNRDDTSWTDISRNAMAFYSSIRGLTNGETYTYDFRCSFTTLEGSIEKTESVTFTVDTSRPEVTRAEIIDPELSQVPGYETGYTYRTDRLYLEFEGEDPESGIDKYNIRIFRSGSSVVLYDGNSTQEFAYLNFQTPLENGRTYYAEVKALNNAGAWSTVKRSNNIVVDTSLIRFLDPECGDGYVGVDEFGDDEDCDCGSDGVCEVSELWGETCQSLGFTHGDLSCFSNCEFDTTGCFNQVCDNDGSQEYGEPCDCGGRTCNSNQLDGKTCQDFGFRGGSLGCYDDCDFDTSGCTNCNNNNNIDSGEVCDGTDLGGFTCQDFGFFEGTLGCDSLCDYDYSGCIPNTACDGDGIAENTETCDGDDFRGRTCSSFDGFNGGELICEICIINFDHCTYCNNDGVADDSEACDGSDFKGQSCNDFDSFDDTGTLACDNCEPKTDGCTIGTCYLNGQKSSLEDCDCNGAFNCNSAQLGGETCASMGFREGTLRCTDQCLFDVSDCVGFGQCDNDNRAEEGETCDRNDLRGATCYSIPGEFTGGTLVCNGECDLDSDGCTVCDNDNTAEKGEACDRNDLRGVTCETYSFNPDVSFRGGSLTCNNDCSFDITRCEGYECDNDGRLEDGEPCDGSQLGGAKCEDFEGFTGGTLTCNVGCSYNFDRCTSCDNDGIAEKDEPCDRNDLRGFTCETYSSDYTGGTLLCDTSCDFDTRLCIKAPKCGDEIVGVDEFGSDEDCDCGEDGVCTSMELGYQSCQTLGYTHGTLGCDSSCGFDISGCYNQVCDNDGSRELGEACDCGGRTCTSNQLDGKTCTDFGFDRGILGCYSDCDFDTTRCGVCNNNNAIDNGETCDGSDVGGFTCQDFGYLSGNLGCSSTCEFDFSGCAPSSSCNNDGNAGTGETCDGDDFRGLTCSSFDGFTGGDLTCDNCIIDTESCVYCNNNGVAEEGEACDGSDFNGQSCDDFDSFDNTGLLSCENCEPKTTQCVVGNCNLNGIKSSLEDCDCDGRTNCNSAQLGEETCQSLGFREGSLSCDTRCHFDVTGCTGYGECDNDNHAEDGEVCDRNDLKGETCFSIEGEFTGGTLVCNGECDLDSDGCTVCDNDNTAEKAEACDRNDLRGVTCETYSLNPDADFRGGSLSCNNDCSFDITNCEGYECDNDGRLEDGEPCDGSQLGGATCEDFEGFTGGTLTCNSDCSYNYDFCTSCDNDGIAEKDEPCDRNDLRGFTCETYSPDYSGGTLRCDSSCDFDTSMCIEKPRCGDSTVGIDEFGIAEDCDCGDDGTCTSAELDYESCQTNGYTHGTLDCDSSCSFDTSGCYNQVCNNDGSRDFGEACDCGGSTCNSQKLDGKTCEDFGFDGGTLGCYNDCEFDTTNCGVCNNNGHIDNGETCDGSDVGGFTCQNFGYISGTLGCTSGCQFDFTNCAPSSSCNNDGNAGSGESCDGNDFRGLTCTSFDGFTGGDLTCDNCIIDTESCVYCNNNGVAEEGEACDGNDFKGQSCDDFDNFDDSGTLSCEDCEPKTSQCTLGTCNLNGIRSSMEDCDCDGRDNCNSVQLNGETCQSLGFREGTLGCDNSCQYDITECTGYGECDNDNNAEEGEICDRNDLKGETCFSIEGEFTGGTLVCNDECDLDSDGCVVCDNDNNAEKGEACDRNDLRGVTCETYSPNVDLRGGTLTCDNDCNFDITACEGYECDHDGNAEDGEPCDGSDLDGMRCEDFAGFTGGTLTCNNDCSFNYDFCTSCDNDGIAEEDEPCDRNDLRGETCETYSSDFIGGTLLCDNSCDFDTGHCVQRPRCGDGTVGIDEFGAAEDCDCGEDGSCVVSELDGESCLTLGYTNGLLGCDANCKFDISGCFSQVCNNDGSRDFGEACDCGGSTCNSQKLDGKTCQDFGFDGGTLGCYNDCEFDTTGCTVCNNNGHIDNGETCDGSDLGGYDCEDFGYLAGTLACSSCAFDFTGCAPSSSCNNDGNAQAGETCDGDDFRGFTCTSFDGFTGGDLTCDNCIIDTESCVYCNNNGVVDEGEACDGNNFRGFSCNDFDSYDDSGSLSCENCEPKTDDCSVGTCNLNGVKSTLEECDCNGGSNCNSAQLGGETCESLGFREGTLSCTSSCFFDTAACIGANQCDNDNTAEGGERCDRNDLRDYTCYNIEGEFTGGLLQCDENCQLNSIGCVFCDNDNNAEKGEVCDRNDLRGMECPDDAFRGGELSCTTSCELDYTGCEGYTCDNDGNAEEGEICDRNDLRGAECSDFEGFTGGTLRCDGTCQLDFDYCMSCDNDGTAEKGEMCDQSDLRGASCESLSDSYSGGTLLCDNSCNYDTRLCIIEQGPYCGDGIINNNEVCDTQSLNGFSCTNLDDFTGGTLGCGSDCSSYNPASCITCDNDGSAEKGEACDGSDLRGLECPEDIYDGGDLSCNNNCELDYTDCDGYTCDNDGIAELGESCDDTDLRNKKCSDFEGFTGGTLRCDDTCQYDFSSCVYCDNDNIAESGEPCDGSDLNGMICRDFEGFIGGTLLCDNECNYDLSQCEGANPVEGCGDGKIQTGETCDGENLDNLKCTDLDEYTGGTLRCSDDCSSYDTYACVTCNNNGIAENEEACDGSDLRGMVCPDDVYSGGSLSCTTSCEFDFSGCEGYTCDNDGTAEFGESCDTSDLDGKKCEDFEGFTGGTLKCDNSCQFDFQLCKYCDNDGVAEKGEACDGDDLNGVSYLDMGFSSDCIKCTNNCEIDTTECEPSIVDYCGNDWKGSEESCDGRDLNGKTCKDFDDFNDGELRCKSNCQGFDTSRCLVCDNDGTAEDAEGCDGIDFKGLTCQNYGFTSGNLNCNNDCTISTQNCDILVCDNDGVQEFGEPCDCKGGTCTSAQLDGKTCQDFGYSGGQLKCNDECNFDTRSCFSCDNDGVAENGEECDTEDIRGMTCEDFNYLKGELYCGYDCRYDFSTCLSQGCDKDGIAEAGEPCDGDDLRGLSCSDFGGYSAGNLKCTTSCELDFSACYYCNNNNVLDNDETCDGISLNNFECSDFDNFEDGDLFCFSCQFETSECDVGACNNDGSKSRAEACDCGGGNCNSEQLGGLQCTSFPTYTGGTLSCRSDCDFDYTGCITCDNDNSAEKGESCDGNDLNNKDCEDFGFDGGTLKCGNDCEFNFEDCTSDDPPVIPPVCTNGVFDEDNETDVDCGNDCPPCGMNSNCYTDLDCQTDYICVGGICEFDGDNETHCNYDIDCGINCPSKCTLGHTCYADEDCSSNNCEDNICVEGGVCFNGVKDPEEAGVDCGGVCLDLMNPKRCETGSECDDNDDCIMGDKCIDNICIECGMDDLDCDGISDELDDDIDNDGYKNWEDPDDDNDGICDTKNSPLNSDICTGDDNDDDGDGISDNADYDRLQDWCYVESEDKAYLGECEDIGYNGQDLEDGDLDNDGIPNFLDVDIDGDGLTNSEDPDDDNDGRCDTSDSPLNGDDCTKDDNDDDNDGIHDSDEIDLDNDYDNDGLENEDDDDIDGDGILNENDPDDDNDLSWDDDDPDDDNDGITDEYEDSDGDGIPDYWEDLYGMDKFDPSDASEDIDGDGLTNLEEFKYGTLPDNADTDSDGYDDQKEIKKGTDPLDPDDHPSSLLWLWILLGILLVLMLAAGGYAGWEYYQYGSFDHMKHQIYRLLNKMGIKVKEPESQIKPQARPGIPGQMQRGVPPRMPQQRRTPVMPQQRPPVRPPIKPGQTQQQQKIVPKPEVKDKKEIGQPEDGEWKNLEDLQKGSSKEKWENLEDIKKKMEVKKARKPQVSDVFKKLTTLKKNELESKKATNAIDKLKTITGKKISPEFKKSLNTMIKSDKFHKDNIVDVMSHLHKAKMIKSEDHADILSHMVKHKKISREDAMAAFKELKKKNIINAKASTDVFNKLKNLKNVKNK